LWQGLPWDMGLLGVSSPQLSTFHTPHPGDSTVRLHLQTLKETPATPVISESDTEALQYLGIYWGPCCSLTGRTGGRTQMSPPMVTTQNCQDLYGPEPLALSWLVSFLHTSLLSSLWGLAVRAGDSHKRTA
jgi:hypothetical protein